MVWMRNTATGCATLTQPALWRSRTWSRAKMVWMSTSTPSNRFSRGRSSWSGTALNSPSAATTLHWASWLSTVLVSEWVISMQWVFLDNFSEQKLFLCPRFETYLLCTVIVDNESAGRLMHSLCGCLRSYSVTPTALLLKQDTKEESRALKAERICLQV